MITNGIWLDSAEYKMIVRQSLQKRYVLVIIIHIGNFGVIVELESVSLIKPWFVLLYRRRTAVQILLYQILKYNNYAFLSHYIYNAFQKFLIIMQMLEIFEIENLN